MYKVPIRLLVAYAGHLNIILEFFVSSSFTSFIQILLGLDTKYIIIGSLLFTPFSVLPLYSLLPCSQFSTLQPEGPFKNMNLTVTFLPLNYSKISEYQILHIALRFSVVWLVSAHVSRNSTPQQDAFLPDSRPLSKLILFSKVSLTLHNPI